MFQKIRQLESDVAYYKSESDQLDNERVVVDRYHQAMNELAEVRNTLKRELLILFLVAHAMWLLESYQ